MKRVNVFRLSGSPVGLATASSDASANLSLLNLELGCTSPPLPSLLSVSRAAPRPIHFSERSRSLEHLLLL